MSNKEPVMADVFILFENGESLDIAGVDINDVAFVDGKTLAIPTNDNTESYHINFDKVLYVNYTESEEE